MINVAVMIGRTRPNRKGEAVARLVRDLLKHRQERAVQPAAY